MIKYAMFMPRYEHKKMGLSTTNTIKMRANVQQLSIWLIHDLNDHKLIMILNVYAVIKISLHSFFTQI